MILEDKIYQHFKSDESREVLTAPPGRLVPFSSSRGKGTRKQVDSEALLKRIAMIELTPAHSACHCLYPFGNSNFAWPIPARIAPGAIIALNYSERSGERKIGNRESCHSVSAAKVISRQS